MLHKHKRALLAGGVFGLVAPFIGVFFGLQVSATLGTILTFPIIILSQILNSPFGLWSPSIMFAGLALSVVAWALVFAVVSGVVRKVR